MDDLSTIVYLRTTEDFYHRERLLAFVERLAALGHYVAGADRREVGQVWMAKLTGDGQLAGSSDAEDVFTPSISPVLRAAIEHFVEQRQDRLEISLFSTAREGSLKAFEAGIDLEPATYGITLYVLGRSDDLTSFLHWLDLLQATYEIWHPLYSYKEGGVEPTTHEEALAGNLTWLYEINLLNHDMVEALSRERVLSTPAWRVTPLEDGSVFLLPLLISNGGKEEDYDYDIEEAAAHLGLEAP